MRRTYLLGILAVVLLFTPSAKAWGQMWPGRGYRGDYGGYGGYYGGDGAWGAYTSALNNATSRNVAEQDRLAGQNAAMQQRAMMQSGIRNTLTTQAQTRTQDILGQQQSNRDWWFQVQQQQLAQRQTMAARPSAGAAPVAGFESAAAPGPARGRHRHHQMALRFVRPAVSPNSGPASKHPTAALPKERQFPRLKTIRT